ncbi:hypothetical protein HZS_4790 [Henneguya salminicola]|nr:hypothetical protein HZS_4790 [Henneguya salminicola]
MHFCAAIVFGQYLFAFFCFNLTIELIHEIGIRLKTFSRKTNICIIVTNIICQELKDLKPALGQKWGLIPDERIVFSIEQDLKSNKSILITFIKSLRVPQNTSTILMNC